MDTTLLADSWHGGPGPWFLVFPLFWVAVAIFIRKVLRRRHGLAGGPGRGYGPGPGFDRGHGHGRDHGRRSGWSGPESAAPTPVETLNRKYADGEIDEFEYRQRYDLLTETNGGSTGADAVTDKVAAAATGTGSADRPSDSAPGAGAGSNS